MDSQRAREEQQDVFEELVQRLAGHSRGRQRKGSRVCRLREGAGCGKLYDSFVLDRAVLTLCLLQCHIRFSSAHLASLMLEHFNTVPSTHMSPAYLSSTEQSATPPENLVLDASRRPIVAQLVEGERERLYWQNLPESTRRGARKSAGGPVALVKKRKAEQAEAQATEGQEDEIAKLVEQELVEVEKEQEQERPRKRPSKI